MIGQRKLLSLLDAHLDTNSFPQFSILVGPQGSGKKTIIDYISKKLDCPCVLYDISVDAIRSLRVNANKTAMRMIYLLPDADKMSPAAKNALLKLTEEPPKDTYIILTVTDLNSVLATIKSRGQVFFTDPYTTTELYDYYTAKPEYNTEYASIVTDVCETPGEIDIIVDMGVKEFYDYVNKVVDNIATVSGSNSFKIAQKIKLKETETDKYDLRLFWKTFMTICSSRLREDPLKYAPVISITSKYLQDLRITGINKASSFDMWLLDIRKEWM